jgi:hypothetical protein
MHFTTQAVITFVAFAYTFVQSAPTAALDAATLLNNGQEAQKLNAQFQTIKLSDACGGTGWKDLLGPILPLMLTLVSL